MGITEAAVLDPGPAAVTGPGQRRRGRPHGQTSLPAPAVRAMSHYIGHPVHYVEDMILPAFPNAKLYPHQADVLDALAESDRVALSGANGMGKDAVTAWAIEWFLITRPLSMIPCTSGVGRQVKEILFAEITRWSATSRMRQYFDLGTVSMRIKGHEKTWFALGFATNADDEGQEEAKAEGWHAEHLLFILTEARAIDPHIWDAARKACTRPGNKIFAQSVKGIEHGEFYHVFTRDRATWRTFSFPSAVLNPEWAPGMSARKYLAISPLVSQQSIDEKLARGEDAPVFRSGVLDQFVKGSENGLIPLSWLEDARRRHLEPSGRLEFGGDVAEGGDDCAWGCRQGPVVLSLEGRQIARLAETCGWFIDEMHRAKAAWLLLPEDQRASTGEPCAKIDRIGLGSGVVMAMEGADCCAVGVNVGESPDEPDKANLKAELYWALRTRAETALLDLSRLPEAEFLMLVEELTTIRYRYTETGKVQIEKKEITRKRLGRSPDRADAMALMFAPFEATGVNVFF